MDKEEVLLRKVRHKERKIIAFFASRILPKVFKKSIRRTAHFQEWYRQPMNYVRMMEIPLTWEFLNVKMQDRILDISSPRLLSLYLAYKGHDVVMADIDDYFVKDFIIYRNALALEYSIALFDSKSIPYENNTFDKIFSISVLEHIAENGDVETLKEIARVLKPNGSCVLTLPAYKHHMEEWQEKKMFYWPTVQNSDNLYFYQRRYDRKTIVEIASGADMSIEKLIFIAEQPIESTCIDNNGVLQHNFFYLRKQSSNRLQHMLGSKLPLFDYYRDRRASYKLHYLTNDHEDENIRQVVVQLTKEKK